MLVQQTLRMLLALASNGWFIAPVSATTDITTMIFNGIETSAEE